MILLNKLLLCPQKWLRQCLLLKEHGHVRQDSTECRQKRQDMDTKARPGEAGVQGRDQLPDPEQAQKETIWATS